MLDYESYREMHQKDEEEESNRPGDLDEELLGPNEPEPPNDAFLLLLPARMHGFGLHDKKWSECFSFIIKWEMIR
jgi:hypothetical protein